MALSYKTALFALVSLFLSTTVEANSESTFAENLYEEKKLMGTVGYTTILNNPMVTSQGISAGISYALTPKVLLSVDAEYFVDGGTADLKRLTQTLVEIANNRSNAGSFEQPLEKPQYNLTIAAQKPLFYGTGFKHRSIRINAILGFALQSSKAYYAYQDNETISLRYTGRDTKVPLVYGLQQTMLFAEGKKGLNIGFNNYAYRGLAPKYDPSESDTYRIYNDLHTSISYVRRF